MSYRELVQAVDDAAENLNHKIQAYNSAVNDLRSVLDDNSGACGEIDELSDANDEHEVDHIDDEMIDAYPMKRELESAVNEVESAADDVVTAKEELQTAVSERDEFTEALQNRFHAAIAELTAVMPERIDPDDLESAETLVDGLERFVKVILNL